MKKLFILVVVVVLALALSAPTSRRKNVGSAPMTPKHMQQMPRRRDPGRNGRHDRRTHGRP